jgi:hypothetical protein
MFIVVIANIYTDFASIDNIIIIDIIFTLANEFYSYNMYSIVVVITDRPISNENS